MRVCHRNAVSTNIRRLAPAVFDAAIRPIEVSNLACWEEIVESELLIDEKILSAQQRINLALEKLTLPTRLKSFVSRSNINHKNSFCSSGHRPNYLAEVKVPGATISPK